jgi:hypothetical protein
MINLSPFGMGSLCAGPVGSSCCACVGPLRRLLSLRLLLLRRAGRWLRRRRLLLLRLLLQLRERLRALAEEEIGQHRGGRDRGDDGDGPQGDLPERQS